MIRIGLLPKASHFDTNVLKVDDYLEFWLFAIKQSRRLAYLGKQFHQISNVPSSASGRFERTEANL